MKLLKSFWRVSACVIALALSGAAPAAQLAPGKDFRLVNPPQPTTSGKQVEVTEFFYYGCPFCNDLQAPLRVWLKRKPADVDFQREPAVFQDAWLPLTAAYHAFEAMGITHKLHYELFSAIHDQRTLQLKELIRDQKPLFDWVASQGVDRKQFMDVYNSFGVRSRTNRSMEMTRNYDIPGTPALVIDGKYLIMLSHAMKANNEVDYERFTQILDRVIAMARKERAGK
jgi:protein dithiol oxidoreductase (disulfide-forming)